jgi:eukaryotic-like serine/threonine-protein kinase
MVMGKSEKVWELLKHSSDPTMRSFLIDRLGAGGVDPKVLIAQLDNELDVSIRRAILLSLGEFGLDRLSLAERKNFAPQLLQFYQNDVDPGTHGAAEWLLRRWGQEAQMKIIDDKLSNERQQRQALASQLSKEKKERSWYVNSQGQTMVLLPGPVDFLMGSPPTEAEHLGDEQQHKKRIGRTFALASKPVTVEQYRKFKKDYKPDPRYSRTDNSPVNYISWYEAAAYCNWLSEKDGINEDQWCYDIMGQVTKLKKNYLSLEGYRLPQEAEVEYATRAEALTNRYYGETDELLPKYAWYVSNSPDLHASPVGLLKPNDFGFFDLQGNVFTWCQDRYVHDYPSAKGAQAFEDREDEQLVVNDTDRRVLRGGSFIHPASHSRSADRGNLPPMTPDKATGDNKPTRDNWFGFRPARTITR